jgi:TetR/AcrR family transcriptional regulator, cholesterol catabolism regulator
VAVNPITKSTKNIPTLVKNETLVWEKRRHIVQAAVKLFVEKGFHTSTTREIAQAAGISIGSLYEYVASKEDVLYLVCDSIHQEMEQRLKESLEEQADAAVALENAVEAFFQVCDRMQDSILLIYRETASLHAESQQYVLQNETRITTLFEVIVKQGMDSGVFSQTSSKETPLIAHTIVMLGHEWALRRWFLHRQYSLQTYTRFQTRLILNQLTGTSRATESE